MYVPSRKRFRSKKHVTHNNDLNVFDNLFFLSLVYLFEEENFPESAGCPTLISVQNLVVLCFPHSDRILVQGNYMNLSLYLEYCYPISLPICSFYMAARLLL